MGLIFSSSSAGPQASPPSQGGEEEVEPVSAPLPIPHRLAWQGCEVRHMPERFGHPREAGCHTPHALHVLAFMLLALIPAW